MSRNHSIDSYLGANPLGFELAKGKVEGHFVINEFGRNDDIDSGVTEDIWQGGGERAFLSAGETMSVVSTSANDTSAGTGARQVTIQGYSNTWGFLSETVSLNGTTPVVTTNAFFRILRIFVPDDAVGSGGENAGDITIDPSTSGSGSRQGFIDAGEGRSAVGHYSTLPGFTTYFMHGKLSLGASDGVAGNREARVKFFHRYAGDGVSDPAGPWILQDIYPLRSNGTGTIPLFIGDTPFALPGPRDIKFQITAASNNCTVQISYTIVNVNDKNV